MRYGFFFKFNISRNIILPRPIQFLAISLMIATGVEWVPHYVAMLSPRPVFFEGTLQRYEIPCDKVAPNKMFCAASYMLPEKLWKNFNLEAPTIGLGILLPATEIECANPNSLSIHYGDLKSDSRAQELFQTYQIAELRPIHCEGDLRITVWAPLEKLARFGYIGGPVIISEIGVINSIKKAIEFFTTQIYFIIAISMMLSVLISNSLPKEANYENLNQNEFEMFSRSWAAFAFFSSGLPEILLPNFSTSLIVVRIVFFFSSIAHLGPALAALKNYKLLPARIRCLGGLGIHPIFNMPGRASLLPIHILAALVVCSPFFRIFLPAIGLTVLPIYFCIGALKKNSYFVCFSICVAIECGKLFNLRYMPYGSMSLAFSFCMILENFLNRVTSSIKEYQKKLLVSSQRAALANFSSQLAHDIRSPLAALQSIIKNSNTIEHSDRVLAKTAINQISEAAKNILEKNIQNSFQENVNRELRLTLNYDEKKSLQLISELLLNVVSLKRAQHARNKNIKINLEISSIKPACLVELYEFDFECILSNLIDNSIDAVGESGVINVLLFNLNERAVVSVSDNGKGISKNLITEIVKRGGSFGKPGGSGLGLSHAKSTIEKWGGDLEIISSESVGTTININIPTVNPPNWFASSINIKHNKTIVIIASNLLVYKLLAQKINDLNCKLAVVHLKSPSDFIAWYRENSDNKHTLYLSDHKFEHDTRTGIDLLEITGAREDSVLISNQWCDPTIQERCKRSGIKLFPGKLLDTIVISSD